MYHGHMQAYVMNLTVHICVCTCGGECVRLFFFFNDTATTEIYTLSLHDALPISQVHLLRCVIKTVVFT